MLPGWVSNPGPLTYESGALPTALRGPAKYSIPIYPLQRVFYPQNLACTPRNDVVPYMLLYTEGTKIRNKTKCTPKSKCQNAVGTL